MKIQVPEAGMRVRVRFDPNCRFSIGERTPEVRALVKQYVKAFIRHLAARAGQPPGSMLIGGHPPAYLWEDANWRFTYTLERVGRRSIATIKRVERA